MTTVSSSSIAAILVAFAAYLLFMIVIGAICMRRTNSSEDYFLGGRGLNAWVAALSAQASDMSGWLLMGLPGFDLCVRYRPGLDRHRVIFRNRL